MTTIRPQTEGSSFMFLDLDAPLFVTWDLTQACNLNCLHCFEDAGCSMPDELTKDEKMHLCKQMVELEVSYVAISGGEPLLDKDFFSICEFLRKYNVILKVETNGQLIDQQVANRFAALGFRSVQVSVDGAIPKSFERLRPKGNWQKAINACKYLVAAGVNTEIVFVPTKFNIHEVGDIVEMAYEMGIYGFYTGRIMRIGRAAQNWDILCPSTAQYDTFFETLKEKQAQYDGKMKVFYYPYEVTEELQHRLECPTASLLILPNGKIKIIGPLPFICGDLRKQTLYEIWKEYKTVWKNPEVIAFTKMVLDEPELLKEANKWKELSPDW
ncbi:MAG: radical SAM protein [Nitrospirota bacterium]